MAVSSQIKPSVAGCCFARLENHLAINSTYQFDFMTVWIFLTAASTLLAAFMLAMYFRERQQSSLLSGKLEVLSRQMADRLDVVESTGLKTRAGLESVLDEAAKTVDQNGGNFCVLYFSLDNFGLLNDAFGHDHGEALLKELSQRLVACTTHQASICQVAPGEFVLVFKGALAIGRRVASSVMNVLKTPLELQEMQTQLTCSIGIAVYPKHGTRSMLLGHASLAARRVRMNGGVPSACMGLPWALRFASRLSWPMTCAKHLNTSSLNSISSQRWMRPTCRSPPQRPCCAGTIRSAA